MFLITAKEHACVQWISWISESGGVYKIASMNIPALLCFNV